MSNDSGADDTAYEWLSADDVGGVLERGRLDGEVAVVTGASKGLGRAVAFALADVGARVAVVSRDHQACREVVAELEDRFDTDALALETDISDPDAVDEMVATVVAEYGTIDVLVNNAGASFVAPVEDISPDGWDRILEINLRGTYLCSRAASDYLSGGGRIVNFSSIAAQFGSNTMSHYAAAKAGVENFTRSLAGQWADRNVRVNCIAPGPILTPGSAGVAGVSSGTAHDRSEIDRPVGSAAEVADTVVFLVSSASSYLTGETITVGGPPALAEALD